MNPTGHLRNYLHNMQAVSSLSDLELIRQISKKDQTALEELYQRYHLSIYNFFIRTTQDHASGEDLLQEFFINVWQGAGKFEARSSVKTWLFRMAHFMSAGWLRNNKKFNYEDDTDAIEFLTNAEDASLENLAFANWNYAQIQKAIQQLTPTQREIIELTFMHELSHLEVSYVLNCQVGTVKSRLHNALHQLNRILIAKGITT